MRFLTWLKSRFRRPPAPEISVCVTIDHLTWETFRRPVTETPREFLEYLGVDYATGITYLSGKPLTDANLNKPFYRFGIKEICSLCILYPKWDALRPPCRGRCPHRPEPLRNFPAR